MGQIYLYPKVVVARKRDDTEKLSELGREGAEARKAKERRRKQRVFAEVMEKLRSGNEHICPID